MPLNLSLSCSVCPSLAAVDRHRFLIIYMLQISFFVKTPPLAIRFSGIFAHREQKYVLQSLLPFPSRYQSPRNVVLDRHVTHLRPSRCANSVVPAVGLYRVNRFDGGFVSKLYSQSLCCFSSRRVTDVCSFLEAGGTLVSFLSVFCVFSFARPQRIRWRWLTNFRFR